MTKPVIPYHGGKSRMAEWICSLMPAHRVYLEPFAGSAAVILAKRRSTHEILNDVDGHLVNFYRVLRDRPDELEYVCRLTPYARDEFAAAAMDDPTIDELERARRYWVRINQSFAHTSIDSTGWSTSIRRGSNNSRTVWNRIDRFVDVVDRLSTVTIENRDALDLIAEYSVPDGVIYADPPYLHSTRAAIQRRPGGDYAHEFATEEQHRQLAKVLAESPATVLLSGYASPLYEELYGGWDRVDRRVLRRTSNDRGGVQCHVIESVWCNRSLDRGLFETAPREMEAAG